MKITFAIVAICIIVFVLQVSIQNFSSTFSLVPKLAFSGYVWQFVTYMFLHGDVMHLFLNMFGLLIFGVTIENTIGRKRYSLLFFVSGLGSALVFLLLTATFTPSTELSGVFNTSLLGASGAIFGIMAAYGLLYPKNWIIMFPGIPMPAIVAVGFFAALEIFYGLTGLEPGIANWGHLGGLLVGAAMITYWKKRARRPKLLIDELENQDGKDWKFVWE